MTCKDCIHFKGVCEEHGLYFEDEYIKNVAFSEDIKDLCSSFKNKADFVEVKHGEWLGIADFGNGNCIGYCSVCGTTQKAENGSVLKLYHRHCYWCGAKMDGRK